MNIIKEPQWSFTGALPRAVGAVGAAQARQEGPSPGVLEQNQSPIQSGCTEFDEGGFGGPRFKPAGTFMDLHYSAACMQALAMQCALYLHHACQQPGWAEGLRHAPSEGSARLRGQT